MGTVLKRFEIWILFLLVAAGLWWAFQTEVEEAPPVSSGEMPSPGGAESPEPEKTEALLELTHVSRQAGPDGSVVELTLLGRSGTDQSVSLSEAAIELTTGEGKRVNRFFLPFETDPVLLPEERSLVTLKYWLTAEDEVLWLTFRDQTMEIRLPSA